jgi:hypothetical protein
VEHKAVTVLLKQNAIKMYGGSACESPHILKVDAR